MSAKLLLPPCISVRKYTLGNCSGNVAAFKLSWGNYILLVDVCEEDAAVAICGLIQWVVPVLGLHQVILHPPVVHGNKLSCSHLWCMATSYPAPTWGAWQQVIP